MADLSITGAGPHASATATDHIPATASGASGYLTPLQLATYTSTAMSNLVLSGQSLTGSAATSTIDTTVTWNTTGTPTAIKLNVTDTASNASSLLMDLQVGGSSRVKVGKDGTVSLSSLASMGAIAGSWTMFYNHGLPSAGGFSVAIGNGAAGRISVAPGGSFEWGLSYPSNTPDLAIYRDAAGALAQRNGTNAQTFRVYNTYTDTSNYERGYLAWSANVLQIGTAAAGTGTARDIEFQIGGVTEATLSAAGLAATVSPSATADADSLGYLGAPQNSQSADYPIVLTDAGKHLYHPASDTTPRTFTIPANASVAFPVGTVIALVNENGAGAITLAITSDTLRWGSSTGSRTIAANGVASLLKVTSTVWRLTGEGIT